MVGALSGNGAGFGYVCAVALALVLVRAAVAKGLRPAETAAGFTALGVPGAPVVAKVVPVAEIAVAVALLAVPRAGGAAALVVLGAFSAFLARAARSGVTAGCNCFGQTRGDPVSGRDVVRNGLLGLLGAAALLAPRPVMPTALAAVVAVLFIAAGAAVLWAISNRRGRRG